MSQRLKVRVVEESRTLQQVPGGAPGAYSTLHASETVERQLQALLASTSPPVELVSISAPGIDVRWLDAERTIRTVTIVVVAVYQEKPWPSHPHRTSPTQQRDLEVKKPMREP
jgi:hypothetical protein